MATVTLSPEISALIEEFKSELKSELERKPAVEETPEMDVEVWSKLPQELLMRVLSHLPSVITRNFIVVCKSWKSEFQQIQISVPLCLSPAFLGGGLNGCSIGPTTVHNSFGCVYDSHGFMQGDSILHHLYLLQSLPTYSLRKLTLDFLATCGRVVTTCKSLICYRSDRTAPNLFSICNPITRTWKSLPPPIELRSNTDFIGMSFDPCARRCMLVIGVNNNTGGHRNQLVMEIFD
ncbi:hypothetical protein SUGI_0474100 [Cryptomeria japonica]|nr:hypothetical protein SUGI_0474100 [Cryptomeria japonica]